MRFFNKTIVTAAIGIFGLTACGQVATTDLDLAPVERSEQAVA